MDGTTLIIGMALVTYFTRALPFFANIRENRFIKFVPAAVFSALVFPDIFSSYEKFVVGAILFVITYKNRNLLIAFAIGVILLYLVNLFRHTFL